MKKSLIALAVLGTAGLGFSGAAVAQSSVTLYGVADAGLARMQNYAIVVPAGTAATLGRAIGANAGAPKVSTTGMTGSGTMRNGTSRLGVRGVEDLGGGLKVGFNFETGLNLGNGNADGPYWQRAANVWVGGNWGTFQMGRALNPTFFAYSPWELTGTANYSVIGNTYGYANLAGGGSPRNDAMFQYISPNFNGFSGRIAYSFKDDNPGGVIPARAKWDMSVAYANGPVAVALGLNKVSSGKTSYVLGGKYSFGNFAVAASYNNAALVTGTYRRGFSIGGSFNTGPFTATLDITRDTKIRVAGVNLDKQTNFLLEGKYALSPRTFMYAAFLRLDKLNNFGIGMRHNF